MFQFPAMDAAQNNMFELEKHLGLSNPKNSLEFLDEDAVRNFFRNPSYGNIGPRRSMRIQSRDNSIQRDQNNIMSGLRDNSLWFKDDIFKAQNSIAPTPRMNNDTPSYLEPPGFMKTRSRSKAWELLSNGGASVQ